MLQAMSLFNQTDFSVVVKPRAASETVEMGDISGWSKEPDRMLIGPL
jgi:hypothetical protein